MTQDLDQSGKGYQRVRTYLGPTLGWVDQRVQPETRITQGGSYAIKPDDSLILVDVAAPVTILLPDLTKWIEQRAGQPATAFEKSIVVKDLGGNANNFNIVVAPFGEQEIDNIQTSVVISQARATVKFVPLIDTTGWVSETSTGGGGGGGGGDVFKAGNNTYTGVNTFTSVITVPNMPVGDNSTTAANTAFVKSQNYITGDALLPYALIASPTFTGNPTAPTPSPGDNDTSIATTAFVQNAIASGGTAAPASAEYVTFAANATLTNERVLTDTPSITWDFSTPGQAKASTAIGGGNVSSVGTPLNGQIARWVTATTIEGVNGSTLFAPIDSPDFIGNPRAPTPINTDNDTSIATTAFVKNTSQPLDADLTSLSALSGTNTIYYRSAPDTWSPVAFSGLSFSGGTLTVTAGGGNVSNAGTPVNNQIAVWTGAQTIEGDPGLTWDGTSVGVNGPTGGNNLVLAGSAAGGDPTIKATGSDTNVDLGVSSKGTGSIILATNNFANTQVQIFNQAGAGTLQLAGGNGTTNVSMSGGGVVAIADANLTGAPKATTPSALSNDTSVVTTAWVRTNFTEPLGQCRLNFVNATTIRLDPYNGNRLFINGKNEIIPAAGVTYTNALLASNQVYNIYALMSGGNIVLEASGTVRATDTTYGHQIKQGDPTRTLVGKIRTLVTTPGQFSDADATRYVLNWYNRLPRRSQVYMTSASSAVSTAPWVLLDGGSARIVYLNWGEDAAQVFGSCVHTGASGTTSYFAVGVDLVSPFGPTQDTVTTVGHQLFTTYQVIPAEGSHNFDLYGGASGGTSTYLGNGYTYIQLVFMG